MKQLILLSILLFLTFSMFGQEENFITKDSVIITIDKEAYHPKYSAIISKNIKYPQRALDKGIQGKCYVSFTVHKNGEISDFHVLKGVPNCTECDQEAIRVLKLMKKWKPAKSKGKSVESKVNVVINFKLE